MKLFSKIIVLLLSFTVLFTLGACANNDQKETKKESKVMTVSCNPEVEFILDSDGRVVSVNAINEEGNMIISAQTEDESFVGEEADDAVELFVEIATETGFLIKGNATIKGNTINVAISGDVDAAKELYESIKQTVQEKLNELGLSTKIAEFQSLAISYIQEKVQEAESYLSSAEIEVLSYEELIGVLENSRIETRDMLSQEMKELYYQVKENAVNSAKIDEAKENLNALQQIAVSTVQMIYETACTTLTTTMNSLLVDSESPYQVALQQFREAKAEYLNLRAYLAEHEDENLQKTLANLEISLNSAESLLETAYNNAIAGLEAAQTALDDAYNTVITTITNVFADAQTVFDTTTESILNSISTLETSFAETYAKQIENDNKAWEDFKNELIAGYNPEEK